MAVCLVTGGAGFIGSHLVEALLARGHVVRVLDNLATGTLTNLARVMDAIELYLGDVTDRQFVRRVTCGAELVFHHAAPTRWPHTPAGPLAAHGPCAIGTAHVLRAARAARVRRVIYASSFRVYGYPSPVPLGEGDATQPLDSYGVDKLLGEQACTTCTRLYGLETVRLRYFNVFGPRQLAGGPYATVISRTLGAVLGGRPPLVTGGGAEDLLYVGDVVHAILLAAEAPRVSGKVYNIARGRRTAARDVVAAINAILGTQIRPADAPPLVTDEWENVGDTSRAEVELGFCAGTDLQYGLRRCIEARNGGASRLRTANGT
jgi:UDP-glucose 4-epimerase